VAAASSTRASIPLGADEETLFNVAYGAVVAGDAIVSPGPLSLLVEVSAASLLRCALRGSRCPGVAGEILEEILSGAGDEEPALIRGSVAGHTVELEGVPLHRPPASRALRAATTMAALSEASRIVGRRWGSLAGMLESKPRPGRPAASRLRLALLLSHLLAPRIDPLYAVVPGGSTVAAEHPEHGRAEVELPRPAVIELTTLPSAPIAPGAWRDVERDIEHLVEDLGLPENVEEALVRDVRAAAARAGAGGPRASRGLGLPSDEA
jgi:hypothetical protein